jgi:hypothetical protein
MAERPWKYCGEMKSMLFAIKAEVSGPQAETRPETELNFNFYRQATNKIAGISDEAAAFLRGFF